MKQLAPFTMILCAVLLLGVVDSIGQLRVSLNLSSRPDPYLSNWAQRKEIVLVNVTNTSSNVIDVKFDCTVNKNGALIANTKRESMQVLTVQPGATMYYGEDLVPLAAVKINSNAEQTAVKTGMLPAGTYEFCVSLIDPATGAALTQPVCKTFTIQSYQAPVLLLPADGDVIQKGQRPLFRWTPLSPKPSFPVRYRLQVFEVMAGQTPITAFRVNQPILDIQDIQSTQLLWPADVELPSTRLKHIWTVRAIDDQGIGIGEPNGYATPFVMRGCCDNDNDVPNCCPPTDILMPTESESAPAVGSQTEEQNLLVPMMRPLRGDEKVVLLDGTVSSSFTTDPSVGGVGLAYRIMSDQRAVLYAVPIPLLGGVISSEVFKQDPWLMFNFLVPDKPPIPIGPRDSDGSFFVQNKTTEGAVLSRAGQNIRLTSITPSPAGHILLSSTGSSSQPQAILTGGWCGCYVKGYGAIAFRHDFSASCEEACKVINSWYEKLHSQSSLRSPGMDSGLIKPPFIPIQPKPEPIPELVSPRYPSTVNTQSAECRCCGSTRTSHDTVHCCDSKEGGSGSVNSTSATPVRGKIIKTGRPSSMSATYLECRCCQLEFLDVDKYEKHEKECCKKLEERPRAHYQNPNGTVRYYEYTSEYVITDKNVCEAFGVKELVVAPGVYRVEYPDPNRGGVVRLRLQTPVPGKNIRSTTPVTVEGMNLKGEDCASSGNSCFFYRDTSGVDKRVPSDSCVFTIAPLMPDSTCLVIEVSFRGTGSPKSAGF